MIDVGYGAAFLAGLLSFFSPCVLPIVPPYLAYLAGMSFNEVKNADADHVASRRIARCLDCLCSGLQHRFRIAWRDRQRHRSIRRPLFRCPCNCRWRPDLVDGPAFSRGIPLCAALPRSAGFRVERKPAGMVGAYVMGLAFAFRLDALRGGRFWRRSCSWLRPRRVRGRARFCSGSTHSESASLCRRRVFSRAVSSAVRTESRNIWAVIEKAMGLLLVITGILFMTGQMSRIAQWLLEMFPAFATIG
jgi:cytochrome c-type biogenesis protein